MLKILSLSFVAATLVSGGAIAMTIKPPPQGTLTRWGGFSVASSNAQDVTAVEVALVSRPNAAGARPETTWINETKEQIWVAEKRVKTQDGWETPQWTTSEACYQLIETLVDLGDLDRSGGSATAVDHPASGETVHVDGFGLTPAIGRPDALRLANGVAAPAGRIVDTALKSWAPCWSDVPPIFAGP